MIYMLNILGTDDRRGTLSIHERPAPEGLNEWNWKTREVYLFVKLPSNVRPIFIVGISKHKQEGD